MGRERYGACAQRVLKPIGFGDVCILQKKKFYYPQREEEEG